MSTDSSPEIEISWEDEEPITVRIVPPLPRRLPPEMLDTPLVPRDQVPTECPACHATKTVDGHRCHTCGGTGTVLAATAAAFRIRQSRVPRF